jgi:hypothetical protein
LYHIQADSYEEAFGDYYQVFNPREAVCVEEFPDALDNSIYVKEDDGT